MKHLIMSIAILAYGLTAKADGKTAESYAEKKAAQAVDKMLKELCAKPCDKKAPPAKKPPAKKSPKKPKPTPKPAIVPPAEIKIVTPAPTVIQVPPPKVEVVPAPTVKVEVPPAPVTPPPVEEKPAPAKKPILGIGQLKFEPSFGVGIHGVYAIRGGLEATIADDYVVYGAAGVAFINNSVLSNAGLGTVTRMNAEIAAMVNAYRTESFTFRVGGFGAWIGRFDPHRTTMVEPGVKLQLLWGKHFNASANIGYNLVDEERVGNLRLVPIIDKGVDAMFFAGWLFP